MEITINQKTVELNDNATVKDALVADGYDEAARGIAVAVNNELVTRSEWNEFKLSQGDDLIIIKAAYGG